MARSTSVHPRPAPGGATRALADYAVGLEDSALPPRVVGQTRTVLADTLGVLAMANSRPAVITAMRAIPSSGGPCAVVGVGRGWSPIDAALVNGIGGHDIELDDFHAPSRTHPAAVIVPAALAAVDLVEDVTYGRLLVAIVAAYDVQTRVAHAIGINAMFERGFHPTSVVGPIGAAVAAGRVLGLSVEETCTAIGLAASQSSGLMTVADDHSHMAKSFQTGVAARNGLTAALMARDGYGASEDVLTGKHDSLRPFGGDAVDPGRLLEDLGVRFEVAATTLKRHACCALTHPAIDALLAGLDRMEPDADVQHIDIALATDAVPRIDGNRLWTHNIQFLSALAASQGRIGLDHYAATWTSDPGISELARRVTVHGDDALQAAFPDRQGAVVTITTADGVTIERVETPKGSPERPLTEEEARSKFLGLTGPLLSEATGGAWWERLLGSDLGERAGSVVDWPRATVRGPGHEDAGWFR